MKKFLSYMKSTLLAAGQLCSARRALHCSKSFALLTTVSLALAVLCTACADNDSPFRSVIPDDPDTAFAIRPLPMQGEEAPWDSRAVNPMSVDKENMIQKIAVFQFDAENNLRPLKNDAGYYIYSDFTDSNNPAYAKKGYSLVTEVELPALSTDLWTRTSSDLKTCVIANMTEDMIIDILFPNGKNNQPINWIDFQKASFDLPFVTPTEVEADQDITGELELGHLHNIYMFGYYEGVVPPKGFTLGLGRTVARLKITFKTDDTKKIDPDGKFYAAIMNHSKTGYLFVNMDASVPQSVSAVFELDKKKFDLTTGEAILQFYSGPAVNEINDENTCTQLLLWYLYSDENGDLPPVPDPTIAADLAKAIKIRLGNNPKTSDYGIVRNTIYSYTLPLRFYGTGWGIEYTAIFTYEQPPLPHPFTDWEHLLLHDGEADGATKINDTDFKWSDVAVGDILRVTYNNTSMGANPQAVLQLRSDPWQNIKSAETNDEGIYNLSASTDYYDVEITQAILDQAKKSDKTGGIVISGKNYTATKVEILRPGYASVKPDNDTYTFNMVWQGSDGWQWGVENMHGHGTVPILLDLSVENRVTGSDFLIDNFLNRSWTAPKPNKYGVIEYVLSSNNVEHPNKKYALKSNVTGKKQIQFDFSKLQYAVTKGENEYIKLVVEDSQYKLIPLLPTTTANEAQFSVTIDPDYNVGYNAETDPTSFTVNPRVVMVNVKIADDFSHMLTPASNLGRIETSNTSIATFIDDKTFTATKAYQGEEIKRVSGVSYSDLKLRSTDPVTDKDRNPITGVSITDGNITFPDNFSGTVYLHFDVDNSVASTHDLKTYKYSDLTLPVRLGQGGSITISEQKAMVQGDSYTLGSGLANYWVDPDYFTKNSDGTVTFKAMDGTYNITVDTEKQTIIAQPPTTATYANNGIIWIDGGNLAICALGIDPLAGDATNGTERMYAPAQISTGVYTYTAKAVGNSNTTMPGERFQCYYIDLGINKQHKTDRMTITQNGSDNNINNEASGNKWKFTDMADGSTYTITITVTSDNAATIKMNKVTLPTPEPANELPYVMDESWGSHYYKISAQDWSSQSPWKDAKAGDVLKATATNINDGAQGVFKIMGTSDSNADWVDLGSVSNLGNGTTEFSVTLTEENITNLNKFGLAVGGIKYTLSALTLIGSSSSSVNYAYRITESDTNYGQGGEEAEGGKTLTLSSPSTLDLATLIADNSSLTHQLVDIAGEKDPIAVNSPTLTYSTSDANLKIENGKLIPLATNTAVTFSATLASPYQGYDISNRNAVPISTTFTGTIDHTFTAQLKSGTTAPTLYEGTTNIDNFLSNWIFTINKTYNDATVHSATATPLDQYVEVVSQAADGDITVNSLGTLEVAENASGTCTLRVAYTPSASLQTNYSYPSTALYKTIEFPYGGTAPTPSEIDIYTTETQMGHYTAVELKNDVLNPAVGDTFRIYYKDVNDGYKAEIRDGNHQPIEGYSEIILDPNGGYFEFIITNPIYSQIIKTPGIKILEKFYTLIKVTKIPASN